MVERPALTRNAEVRYLGGQPAVDVAYQWLSVCIKSKGNCYSFNPLFSILSKNRDFIWVDPHGAESNIISMV